MKVWIWKKKKKKKKKKEKMPREMPREMTSKVAVEMDVQKDFPLVPTPASRFDPMASSTWRVILQWIVTFSPRFRRDTCDQAQIPSQTA